MISHRQVMTNAAMAVRDSAAVRDYCVRHFGRGLEIVVGAYPGTEDASGIPGVKESPFLWIYATGENEDVKTDEKFTMHATVGGCVSGPDGEQVISNVVTPRSESANGLIVNGGNKVVEDLRDSIMAVIEGSLPGAIIDKMRRTENDLSHFPLEWAEFEVDFMDPETI